MVSRRTYFTITILMFVILFMFQFTGVIKETLTDYETNQFASSNATDLTSQDSAMIIREAYRPSAEITADKADGYVIYIGDDSDVSISSTVAQWGIYTKREVRVLPSLKQYQTWESNPPEVILIDSAYLNHDTDVPILQKLAKQGISLIFCNLPDYTVIAENKELQEILGIHGMVSNQVRLSGIQLFKGFLLGGEVTYKNDSDDSIESLDKEDLAIRQDLDFEIPWYVTKSGTKTYMMGLVKDESIENESLPAIIWRNSYEGSPIFAINGDYLNDSTGIGILTAMMAEMHAYEIYPVVNAQNLVLANYPGLAPENAEEMKRLYYRSQKAVFRDVIWPQIMIIAAHSEAKLSCMIAPQLDYMDGNEPEGNDLAYYLKLLHEQNAEAGLSAARISNTTLEAKLERDYSFWQNHMPSYDLLSFYFDDIEDYNPDYGSLDCLLTQPLLQNIRTLFTNYDKTIPVISYAGDEVTLQSAVMDGYRYTYSGDLRLRSLQTALGYSGILLDLKQISYPETEEDATAVAKANTKAIAKANTWENVSEQFAITIDTCLNNFRVFGKTTLTESDKRIREFFALDYSHKREDHKIVLDITGFHEEAWFILRLHGERIDTIQGGSYEKIENGAYLIHADKSKVEIKVKQDPELFYHD